MTTAVLSLGSNMGDARAHLAAAVAGLGPAVRAVSSVYRTPPWGPVEQDDFLNIVAIVSDPEIDAAGWWVRAQRLEQAAHRERLVRWGPRTLDVDVIAVWRESRPDGSPYRERQSGREAAEPTPDAAQEPILSDDPDLTLPHPRAAERGFVLVPWAEVQPDAVLPGAAPIRELLAQVDVSGIERVGRLGD